MSADGDLHFRGSSKPRDGYGFACKERSEKGFGSHHRWTVGWRVVLVLGLGAMNEPFIDDRE